MSFLYRDYKIGTRWTGCAYPFYLCVSYLKLFRCGRFRTELNCSLQIFSEIAYVAKNCTFIKHGCH
jgi:hypothetical protein